MSIEEMANNLGAPSVAALQTEMTSLGLTIEDVKGSEDYRQAVKKAFASSALATTSEAAPVKAKRGRKPAALKKTTLDNVAKANRDGVNAMTTIANTVNANQMEQFGQLAQQLAGSADQTSDAIAELALAYPGLVNQLAAQKINEGLKDAEPGFRWADQNNGINDRLQSIREEFFGAEVA